MDLVQVYEWIIILEPIGGLFLGIIGGLIVLLVWRILKPWLKSIERQARKKEKRIEKLKQNLKKDKSDEIRKKSLIELRKLVAVDSIQIIIPFIVLGLLILLALQAHKYFENDIWESRNTIVQMIDEQKKNLYLRTKREPIDPICVGEKERNVDENNKCVQYWEREKTILERQFLCQKKALLDSKKSSTDDITNIGNTILGYQVCMLEEGWHTEPCPKGEKGCVELMFAESICTSFIRDWLANRGSDIAIRICEESGTR